MHAKKRVRKGKEEKEFIILNLNSPPKDLVYHIIDIQYIQKEISNGHS